jgi:hypothetical protein
LFALEFQRVLRALHNDVEWTVFDPEAVEERNVANQVWLPGDVGKPKVAAIAKHLRNMGGKASIAKRATPADIMSLKSLPPHTLIVCAIDKVKEREQLWLAAKCHARTVLWLGLSETGDGSADWTHLPEWDNAPFKSSLIAQGNAEAMGALPKRPPCELIKFRSAGMNLALAGVKAAVLYLFGQDFDRVTGAAERDALRWLSEWDSTVTGHSLRITFDTEGAS